MLRARIDFHKFCRIHDSFAALTDAVAEGLCHSLVPLMLTDVGQPPAQFCAEVPPSVAIWMGSFPDSRPSQRFSSLGDATTYRPWRLIGIPDFAQRWAVETDCPKNSATCRQPFKEAGSIGP